MGADSSNNCLIFGHLLDHNCRVPTNMHYSTWFENPDNKLRIILLAFVILLLPFLALSFFVFPTTDDYCHALGVIDMGYWGYQEHYWKTWSGRYIGTIISATQPLSYGSYLGYKIAPIILICLYAHAMWVFVKAITFNKLVTWQTALIAFLLTFVLIAELPIVSGYFYWYTGYYYTLADIGTLHLFAYLFRNYSTLKSKHIAIICLSMIILIGTNEYTLVWLVALTGAFFLFGSLANKKIQYSALIMFLIALAFGVLSITAPGNAVRAESGLYPTPLKFNLIFSIQNSLVTGVLNFSKMAPTLCVLALVLIPYAAQIYHKKEKDEFRFLSVHPIISLIVFFGCLFLTYFPTYWSIAGPPNLRGQCVITFWTLIGFTYNVFVITFWAIEKYNSKIITRFGLIGWVIALYFVTIYTSNFNYRSAWSDVLTGRAARFYAEMEARTKQVYETEEHSVYVPKLKNTPYSILIITEAPDPAWGSVEYNNGCAEWYFKKKFFLK